jgi:hypothetical protein
MTHPTTYRRPMTLLPFTLSLLATLWLSACSDDAGGNTGGTDDTSGATSGSTSGSTSGDVADTSGSTSGDDATDTSGSTSGDDADTSGSTSGDDADTAGGPCADTSCGATERCEVQGGQPVCVPLGCDALLCESGSECQLDDAGEPACVDITCTQNADCDPDRFCDGTVCVRDACDQGSQRCDASGDLLICAPDGSTERAVACEGVSGASACVVDAQGQGRCGCEDDWDCPTHMRCEVGLCAGTGLPPTCTLPPVPFRDVPPANELQWGGATRANPNAVGSAYPESAQVLSTPLVANLDDDNGDGLINELDFPEIIFTSYHGGNLRQNGVLRAIHGGGAKKGQDLFANCGPTTWRAGDDVAAFQANCNAGPAANGQAGSAIGDIDSDGVPEIVYPGGDRSFTLLRSTGEHLFTSPPDQWPLGNGWPAANNTPTPSIANIDGAGFAEVIFGNRVFTFAHDDSGALTLVDRFDAPDGPAGTNSHGPITCVADLNGDRRQDIISGTIAYTLPLPPAGASTRADCATNPPSNASEQAFCDGQLTPLWDAVAVNAAPLPGRLGPIDPAHIDGFCAVADILGADQAADPSPQNPLDGRPEVILISDGFLIVLDGVTGGLYRYTDLGGGRYGGTPNVDDFDGDGFPEIATALENFYTVFDLQAPSAACPVWPNLLLDTNTGLNGNPPRTPGDACTDDTDCADGAFCRPTLGGASACTCYFNSWRQDTEDDSSRNTASSVFDFNGDGAAEVVYNDECFFRIYDGINGQVLSRVASLNRTTIENPVVADIDNDGNAEIVFSMNNETIQCAGGSNQLPNGVGVWGDTTDTWVSARRIWNQHAYHVTNVLEDGRIPTVEVPSWTTYNTYRSNPRSFGLAPDLTVSGIQLFNPDSTCGDLSTRVTINVEVRNRGDLRVGPGVPITLSGVWGADTQPLLDASGQPLRFILQNSLEPGAINRISFDYDASANGANPDSLPERVIAIIDGEGGNDYGTERECDEDNNTLDAAILSSGARADLAVTLNPLPANTACPGTPIETTVTNLGTSTAVGVTVRYFAGNPEQGGTPFLDYILPDPLDPGASVTFSPTFTYFLFNTIVYAVVDPDDTIPECNDANNTFQSTSTASCAIN